MYFVEIPAIGFARRVQIPELANVNLFTLEFEEKNLTEGGEVFDPQTV